MQRVNKMYRTFFIEIAYYESGMIKKKNNWVLSYNPNPTILELYKDYEIVYPEWTYGMSADKTSKEILVLNVKEKTK